MAAGGETVVVTMTGGSPWGFRLYGGDHDPLMVAKLRRKSKAQEAGLVEGDVLLGVTGYSCQGVSHATAMGLVDTAGDTLTMHVLRGNSERHVYDAAIQALGGQIRPVPASAVVQASPAGGRSPAPGYSPAPREPAPQASEVSLTLQPVVNGDRSATSRGHSPSQFSRQRKTFNEGDSTTDVTTETSQEKFGGTTVTKTRREIVTRSGYGPSAPHEAPPSQPKASVWAPSGGGGGGGGGAPATVGQPMSMTIDFGGGAEKENIAPTPPQPSPAQQAPMFKVNKFSNDGPAVTSAPPPGLWQPTNVPAAAPKRQAPSPQMEFSQMSENRQYEQKRWDSPGLADIMKGVPPHLQKILMADPGSGSDFDSDSDMGILSRRKIDATMNEDVDSPLLSKKMFADSAFYDDEDHKYPTIEEQIKMARKVALSLTAPANKKARGHTMFMKRVNKADKWTSDRVGGEINITNDDEEVYYNPNPWAGDGHTWQPAPAIERSGPQLKWDIPKAPPLPPLPNLFAPSLPKGKDKEEKAKALSAEEFERMRLYEQKTDHSTVSPQVCFNLAEDLRSAKGRGSKMFAKRAAKSDEWVVDEDRVKPNPELMQRLLGSAPAGAATMSDMDTTRAKEPADDGTPTNRLQQMIDPPKAKMTPWDAMAQFGDVDQAFDHLKSYRPYGKSYQSKIADNLESVTKQTSTSASFTPGPQKGLPMGGGSAILPELSQRIKPWGGGGGSSGHSPAQSAGMAPVQFKLPPLPTTTTAPSDPPPHQQPPFQSDSSQPKPFQHHPKQQHPTGPAPPAASFTPMSRAWASTTDLDTQHSTPSSSSLAGSPAAAFGSTAAVSGPSPSAGAAGGFRPVKFKMVGMDGGASPIGPSSLHPAATGAAAYQRHGVSPAPSGGSGAASFMATEDGYCDL